MEKNFMYIDSTSYDTPEFGFKIHISGTTTNYHDIYGIVIPYLKSNDISFKYIRRKEDVYHNLSDEETAAESGKLITIYPSSREHCIELLDELYNLLPENLEGVYILSDRNYKDSKTLFYRFGCIRLTKDKLVDGLPTVVNSDGSYWQDYQKTYFDLPSWINDIQEEQVYNSSYLSETYQILEVLKQSNGGNVYKAQCKDNKELVIIKESRPHILAFDTVYKSTLRKNEWDLSGKSPESVRNLEQLPEWLNHYYIYKLIEGVNLRTYSDKLNLFSYHSSTIKTNLENYLQLLAIFREVLSTIKDFHNEGIVLNDIHPDNFIVNHENRVHFIDLENSYFYKDSPLTGIYSEVALKEWNQRDGKIADCHKVANMFLYLLGRLQLRKTTDQLPNICELLLQKNIESNLDSLIKYLLSDQAEIHFALEMMQTKIYANINKETENGLARICQVQSNFDLLEFVLLQENLQKFRKAKLMSRSELLTEITSIPEIGLDGIMGILVYLKSIDIDEDVLDDGVAYVLRNLVTVENGLIGVQISEYGVSPYLLAGTSGIILGLLFINSEKYEEEIIQLANTINVEYAQSSDFLNGMLGIAQTLIELYLFSLNQDYLVTATELLQTCELLIGREHPYYPHYLFLASQIHYTL